MTKQNLPNHITQQDKDQISNYISVEAIRQLEEQGQNDAYQKYFSNPPNTFQVNYKKFPNSF
jgi:predicted nucleic acid-binding protein